MKRVISAIPGNSRQRGFWLRCFLGRVFFALAASLALTSGAHAKIDIPGPIRLIHLQGIVVTPYGESVQNAEVSLLQDGKVVATTRTDVEGQYDFEHVSGHFLFRIQTPNYSIVSRQIVVDFEIAEARHKHLYVILGPGACTDDCSTVFTSKGQFQKALQKRRQRKF